LGRLELKSASHRPGSPSEVDQWQLGPIFKNNAIFEARHDHGAGFQVDPDQSGCYVLERLDLYLETELELRIGIAARRFLELNLIIWRHLYVNLRQGDILFRIEIEQQILVADHSLIDQNALSWVDPAKFSRCQYPPSNHDRP